MKNDCYMYKGGIMLAFDNKCETFKNSAICNSPNSTICSCQKFNTANYRNHQVKH